MRHDGALSNGTQNPGFAKHAWRSFGPTPPLAMRVSPLNLSITAYILEVEGFDKLSALQRCGLKHDAIQDEQADWVPIATYARLVEAVLAETGDPAFGLVAGKSLALTRFNILVAISVFTPTLRQLLADVHRFSVLLQERAEYSFDEYGGAAILDIHPILQEGIVGRYRYDFVVTSVTQMLRFGGLSSAEDIYGIEIPFACEPALLDRYRNSWGTTRIKFDQRACRIAFNPALLDKPLPGHDPVSYTAAKARAEAALNAQVQQLDTEAKVRQWLLSAFPQQPDMPETARQLGLSERSLRRKLASLGTSHQDIAQECQFLKSQQLLAEGQLSIKQIADALGFSSVTSFHRAFKRWTGVTPLAWKAEQQRD